ncbi:hypothetical protein NDU88_006711 [Pleurodeles waltl]|uniref:Uncharacterized protein n=1 Tax=Pleurodeles waltl TaxID=8319 RepID=A0AAV7N1M6_PLEWA|nr:hypothetical protein NDU88_006711 [Pleurodeles waltl]
MEDVHCHTNEFEALSDILLTSFSEEKPEDVSPLDEYVLDLDLEDHDGDDFLIEEDVLSTSDMLPNEDALRDVARYMPHSL